MTNACAAQLDDLGPIARINDQVKAVVAVSRSMNLIAINAMLTAKQAGERARGFTVVAGEMRVFSRQLDASMEVLHTAISRLVHDVAFLRKEQRQLRYLAVARDMTPANRSLLGPAVEDARVVRGKPVRRAWRRGGNCAASCGRPSVWRRWRCRSRAAPRSNRCMGAA